MLMVSRAEQYNIPVAIVQHKDYNNSEIFSNTIIKKIGKYPVDLIILAGFLHLLRYRTNMPVR